MKLGIKEIRLNYKYKCNLFPTMKPVLECLMRDFEKKYVLNNLHSTFALFSDENVAFTNPTYETLNKSEIDNFSETTLNLAYEMLFNSQDYTKYDESNKEKQRTYKDIAFPFGIFRKSDILCPLKKGHKITDLDLKIIKLTPQILNKCNISKSEYEIIINKIKHLKKIFRVSGIKNSLQI